VPRPDVCVVGEINCDLILHGLPEKLEPETEILAKDFRLTLGSSSAIFAHNLSALGTRTGIVSMIGDDPLGRIAIGRLADAGADVSAVKKSATGTSTGVTVILAQAGPRYIFTYPGTMFEFCFDDIDLEYVFSARHLHLSSYFLHRALRPQIAQLFREAKRNKLTTSLDTNDDPENLWGDDLLEVLPHVDIFLPNAREAKAVARCADLNQAIEKLCGLARLVVIKLGREGAVAREGSREWRRDGLPVAPIDPVGAGDSFDAGFIHKFLKGASCEECLHYANIAGAFSTTCAGGTEAFRNRERMDLFFREQMGQGR
jgi:sugar/nucleoside kinase (ribokinase family)